MVPTNERSPKSLYHIPDTVFAVVLMYTLLLLELLEHCMVLFMVVQMRYIKELIFFSCLKSSNIEVKKLHYEHY